jgi:hypothetical protein
MLVLAQLQPSAAVSKKYSCPINKHVYQKQIVSKMKALDEKIQLTLLQCNSPPNNTLDQYTCNLLWNDIEEMSKNMFFMEEDLELVEKEIKRDNKSNFLKWIKFLQE